MLEKIKAIIFDMDGTLLDSESVTFSSFKEMMKEWSIDIDKKKYQTLIGASAKEIKEKLEIILDNRVPVDEVIEQWHQKHEDYLKDNPYPLKPFVKEAFDYFISINMLVAIGTSSSREKTLAKISHYDFLRSIKVIQTADDVGVGKPAPDIFLACARQLNLPPECCLVLEDSKYGVESAYCANMPVIMIPDMLQPHPRHVKKGLVVMNDMKEVICFFKNFKQNINSQSTSHY